MPISLPLNKYSDFNLSDSRLQTFENLQLDWIDYYDSDKVEAARRAITQMGTWDRIIDLVFQGGAKYQALEAIATVVLCQKAAERNEDLGFDFSLPHGLRESDRQAAIGRLMELSSPAGRDAFLSNPVLDGTSVQFSAPTYHWESRLLALRMPATMAVELLERNFKSRCSEDIYKAAAEQLGGEAALAIAAGRMEEAAACYEKQALWYKEAALYDLSKEATVSRAMALHSLGHQRKDALRDGEPSKAISHAAKTFRLEAEVRKAVGDRTGELNARRLSAPLYQQAASQLLSEQTLWSEENLYYAGRAFRRAAEEWTALGEGEHARAAWIWAAQCYESEAQGREITTFPDYGVISELRRDAAEARREAGYLAEAARLYRDAARCAEAGGKDSFAQDCERKAQEIENAAKGPGSYGL